MPLVLRVCLPQFVFTYINIGTQSLHVNIGIDILILQILENKAMTIKEWLSVPCWFKAYVFFVAIRCFPSIAPPSVNSLLSSHRLVRYNRQLLHSQGREFTSLSLSLYYWPKSGQCSIQFLLLNWNKVEVVVILRIFLAATKYHTSTEMTEYRKDFVGKIIRYLYI